MRTLPTTDDNAAELDLERRREALAPVTELLSELSDTLADILREKQDTPPSQPRPTSLSGSIKRADGSVSTFTLNLHY